LSRRFEKAHPSAIPNIFLGAFDSNAQLVDTKTNTVVPTSDAIFILTSNYGADAVMAHEADLLSANPQVHYPALTDGLTESHL
jgi:ATP-dependent Clp protease ATP-binding subunit ClpA